MMKSVAVEEFRFVIQTQQCLPSLADPRAPTPPIGPNEQATRWSGDGARSRNGAMPCSVRSRDMALWYQK